MMKLYTAALLFSALLNTVWAQNPAVSVRPRAAAVKPGETVNFNCRVLSGSQPVQLEWKKTNNQPMGDNVKIDGGVLTVTNVRLNNQGSYRCVAANAQGKAFVTATLSVKQPPKVRITPSGPLMLTAGESVSLECTGSGKPRPSVSWYKQETGSEMVLVSTTTENRAVLQVTVMKAEDAGTFVCQAQNREGSAEGKVELTMVGGVSAGTLPQASVSDTDLAGVEGRTVTMHCHATGSPTPVVSWSKLRAPLPWQHTVTGGSLTLNNLGRQDSGQYICNATNAAGYSEAYVQLEVDSPPYATILLDDVVARAGDAIRLQCIAHGSHPIRFHWTRVGGSAMSPGAETTKEGLLKISQLKVSDSGAYKCIASNHVGSNEALTKVTVKDSQMLSSLTVAMRKLFYKPEPDKDTKYVRSAMRLTN
ncbi:Basement membrane-specific heparan sulfate proteoglycan core protein [Triplophysa tibetana]|uniref:Basement membrane-specific heparan sulfate proteoglycan core protein n=1 Tax=Triplophysa tibetana TaxID=1572043 RepID=A0A5A9PI20_9TELE|nr:Basement membrane-specific heparan sulfate proteoglycan core protein [Triplophysa tibetana]